MDKVKGGEQQEDRCRGKDSSDCQGGTIPSLAGCQGCRSLVSEIHEEGVLIVLNVSILWFPNNTKG